MTYASGQTIEATDLNNLSYKNGAPPTSLPGASAKAGDIFGTGYATFGYGGNSTNVALDDLSVTTVGSDITSAQWTNLRNAIADIAAHQGTTLTDVLPATSLLETGDEITFFTTLNSSTNNTDIRNNRLTVDGANVTLTASALTSNRVTSWGTIGEPTITHEFTVDFGDADSARYFFNTGGEIRINASRSGGSATTQNTDWTYLLSANSPYTFTGSDYFTLTAVYADIFMVIGGTYVYGDRAWTIRARRDDAAGSNGSNGSVIRIQSEFTNGDGSTVDGTLTSDIDVLRSTVVFPRPLPTLVTTSAL